MYLRYEQLSDIGVLSNESLDILMSMKSNRDILKDSRINKEKALAKGGQELIDMLTRQLNQ